MSKMSSIDNVASSPMHSPIVNPRKDIINRFKGNSSVSSCQPSPLSIPSPAFSVISDLPDFPKPDSVLNSNSLFCLSSPDSAGPAAGSDGTESINQLSSSDSDLGSDGTGTHNKLAANQIRPSFDASAADSLKIANNDRHEPTGKVQVEIDRPVLGSHQSTSPQHSSYFVSGNAKSQCTTACLEKASSVDSSLSKRHSSTDSSESRISDERTGRKVDAATIWLSSHDEESLHQQQASSELNDDLYLTEIVDAGQGKHLSDGNDEGFFSDLTCNNLHSNEDIHSRSELLGEELQAAETALCQVCGDVAAGFHCGAFVCEACKKFFVRCLKQEGGTKFVCLRNSSCEINKDTRTQCQYCRYQKCLLLGMYRPGGTNVSSEICHIPCRVCGAPSSGYHFGAITCEGCKKHLPHHLTGSVALLTGSDSSSSPPPSSPPHWGFFRRTIKERDFHKYQCSRDQTCVITSSTRNVCKYCRYQKCLEAGMKSDGSRIGRQPNSIKHATMVQLKQIKSSLGLNTDNIPIIVAKPEPLTDSGYSIHQELPLAKSGHTHCNNAASTDSPRNSSLQMPLSHFNKFPYPSMHSDIQFRKNKHHESIGPNYRHHSTGHLSRPPTHVHFPQASVFSFDESMQHGQDFHGATESLPWNMHNRVLNQDTIMRELQISQVKDTCNQICGAGHPEKSADKPECRNAHQMSMNPSNQELKLISEYGRASINDRYSDTRHNGEESEHIHASFKSNAPGIKNKHSVMENANSVHFSNGNRRIDHSYPPKCPNTAAAQAPDEGGFLIARKEIISANAEKSNAGIQAPANVRNENIHAGYEESSYPCDPLRVPRTAHCLSTTPIEHDLSSIKVPRLDNQSSSHEDYQTHIHNNRRRRMSEPGFHSYPVAEIQPAEHSAMPASIVAPPPRVTGEVLNSEKASKNKPSGIAQPSSSRQDTTASVDTGPQPPPTIKPNQVCTMGKAHKGKVFSGKGKGKGKTHPPEDVDSVIETLQMAFSLLSPILQRNREVPCVKAGETMHNLWKYMMSQFKQSAQATIMFAKKVPGFTKLPIPHQISILQTCMYPIVLSVLSLTYDLENEEYNYFNLSSEEEQVMLNAFEPFNHLIPTFHMMGKSIQDLEMDTVEVAFLCAIHLSNEGNTKDTESLLVEALMEYEKRKDGEDTGRHAMVLLRLGELVRANIAHQKSIFGILSQPEKYNGLEIPQLFEETYLIDP